jgi:hypothetical protein
MPSKATGPDKESAGTQDESGGAHDTHNKKQVGNQASTADLQDPPRASIYTFNKGYYKVSAGKLRAKQSMGRSSMPLPGPKEVSVSKPSSAPVKNKVQPVSLN